MKFYLETCESFLSHGCRSEDSSPGVFVNFMGVELREFPS